jgi:hypothetical protein
MRLYKLIEGMARPTIPAGLSPEMNKYLHDLDDYLRRLGQKMTTANISGDVDTTLITNFTDNVTTIVNEIIGEGGVDRITKIWVRVTGSNANDILLSTRNFRGRPFRYNVFHTTALATTPANEAVWDRNDSLPGDAFFMGEDASVSEPGADLANVPVTLGTRFYIVLKDGGDLYWREYSWGGDLTEYQILITIHDLGVINAVTVTIPPG